MISSSFSADTTAKQKLHRRKLKLYETLDNLFLWLLNTFEARSKYHIERSSKVPLLPYKGLSKYIRILEFIDDFDFQDKNTLVNIGLIVGLICVAIGAYYIGAVGTVQILFGFAVFGNNGVNIFC